MNSRGKLDESDPEIHEDSTIDILFKELEIQKVVGAYEEQGT